MNLVRLTKTAGLLAILCFAAAAALAQDGAPREETLINKRPIVDFQNALLEKFEKGDVNWQGEFSLELTGSLDGTGRIDPNSVIVNTNGDPRLAAVALDGIEAINSAGFFQYINGLLESKITIILAQDDKNFTAVLRSSAETATRAKSVEQIFTIVKTSSLARLRQDPSPGAKYDESIFNATSISRNEKIIEIKMLMPKTDFHGMIKQLLTEQ